MIIAVLLLVACKKGQICIITANLAVNSAPNRIRHTIPDLTVDLPYSEVLVSSMKFLSLIGLAFINRGEAQRRRKTNRPDDEQPSTPVTTTASLSPTTAAITSATPSTTPKGSNRDNRTSTSAVPVFVPPSTTPGTSQAEESGTSTGVWIGLVGSLLAVFVVAAGLLLYQRKRIVEHVHAPIISQ